MKKALLASLFVMIISSWCLAQTDSLPAPTAEPCQPATCSEPCQPWACDIPCQPAPCAEPFVPKWAVGIMSSSLTNIPDKYIFERTFGFKDILRFAITGNYSNSNYYYIDRNWSLKTGLLWLHDFEIKKGNFIKPLIGLYFTCQRSRSEKQYSSLSTYRSLNKETSYTVGLPLELTHYFTCSKYHFGIGVESSLFSYTFNRKKETRLNAVTGNVDNVEDEYNSINRSISALNRPSLIVKYFFK